MEVRAERSLDVADSRDSNVETAERACRIFSGKITIDMRFVCPKDVRTDAGTDGSFSTMEEVGSKARVRGVERGSMAGTRASSPASKKVKENWTEKHRNVARKIFLRGGWTQKRLFDVDWSDISQCQACQKEEGTEKHRLYHSPQWYEVRRDVPEVFRKLEQKARTSKKEWMWQRGIDEHPLSGSQWNRGHFSMRKSGSLRSTRAGVCQQKASRATLPLTAPCRETLASGEHAVGQ